MNQSCGEWGLVVPKHLHTISGPCDLTTAYGVFQQSSQVDSLHLFEYHLATWYLVLLKTGTKTCGFHCHCGTSNDMTISNLLLKTQITNLAQPKIKCHKNQRGKQNSKNFNSLHPSKNLHPPHLFKKHQKNPPPKIQKIPKLQGLSTKPSTC